MGNWGSISQVFSKGPCGTQLSVTPFEEGEAVTSITFYPPLQRAVPRAVAPPYLDCVHPIYLQLQKIEQREYVQLVVDLSLSAARFNALQGSGLEHYKHLQQESLFKMVSVLLKFRNSISYVRSCLRAVCGLWVWRK